MASDFGSGIRIEGVLYLLQRVPHEETKVMYLLLNCLNEERYYVFQAGRTWRCDCGDFQFRRDEGLDPGGCKHIRALIRARKRQKKMIIERCARELLTFEGAMEAAGGNSEWTPEQVENFRVICEIASSVEISGAESLKQGQADHMVANAVKLGTFKIKGSAAPEEEYQKSLVDGSR